ncbi:MAG: hypothetical protein SVG88_07940 [Halobacteriales archaeon]|nr:hypothetical protein [Halobacteriales archaeon]
MSDPSHTHHRDPPTSRDRTPPEEREHPATALRTMTVEYTDRPDQRTICPRGITRNQLMATWITADASDFVDLKSMR